MTNERKDYIIILVHELLVHYAQVCLLLVSIAVLLIISKKIKHTPYITIEVYLANAW